MQAVEKSSLFLDCKVVRGFGKFIYIYICIYGTPPPQNLPFIYSSNMYRTFISIENNLRISPFSIPSSKPYACTVYIFDVYKNNNVYIYIHIYTE